MAISSKQTLETNACCGYKLPYSVTFLSKLSKNHGLQTTNSALSWEKVKIWRDQPALTFSLIAWRVTTKKGFHIQIYTSINVDLSMVTEANSKNLWWRLISLRQSAFYFFGQNLRRCQFSTFIWLCAKINFLNDLDKISLCFIPEKQLYFLKYRPANYQKDKL